MNGFRRFNVSWLYYGLISLIIVGPIVKPGFVLTLDMVFTPKLPSPQGLSNTYLFYELLHVINFVLPGQVIEKILMFIILLLCGIGMYRLLDTSHQWSKYFAGIFYMINPFVYERWMAGQYLVVFGYALLPFLVKALHRLYTKPDRAAAIKVTLWYSALALVSIHNFVLGVLLGIIMFFIYLAAQSPKGDYYRAMWRYGGLVIASVLALNCYWLLAVVIGHSPISTTISHITNVDFSAFTTAYNVHGGLFFNVLSLYGFWLERFGRYAMPNHDLVVWYSGFGLLAALVLTGVWKLRRQRSLLALSLALAALIGLVMSLGVEAPVTGGFTRWIITSIPLMKGFREPEKFSALLVLAYAYFAGWGLEAILNRLPAKAEATIELIRDGALLLPIVYVSTMPFGFANQLKPVSYPASWYSFNQQIIQRPPAGKLLFLPWNEYMSYDFTPRIIANPAPNFFDAPVIAGTNAQFGNLDDPFPTPTSSYIETQVLAHTNQTNLGAKLASLHIQYVLLASGYDVNQYGWLAKQTDLQLVSRQAGLTVYRNEAFHG